MTARRAIIFAAVAALGAPHPEGHGWLPMGVSLALTAFGDVGHGPRWFWLAWDGVILLVYFVGCLGVLTGTAWLWRRFSARKIHRESQ